PAASLPSITPCWPVRPRTPERMKGTAIPRSTSPAKCGRTTGSSRYCCRSGTACSPRSREATRKPLGLESSNHRFQGITKPSCLIGCELNNESPAAFKRDTHHDAAPLLGDLKRTLPRPPDPHHGPCPGSAHAAPPPPAAKPPSHNRFYLSPYYPVFGSRMVMIGDPYRRQSACNSLFLWPFGDFAGASPWPGRKPGGRAR